MLELSRHPEVVARLRAEIDPLEIISTATDFTEILPKLKYKVTFLTLRYLDSVIKEQQRLHSVVQKVIRESVEPVTMLGYEIPAGVRIFIYARVFLKLLLVSFTSIRNTGPIRKHSTQIGGRNLRSPAPSCRLGTGL
jgi:hypothetical protein